MNDVLAVNLGEFDQIIAQSDKPVLVDFWAEWCAPCRVISPLIEDLAEDYANDIKVIKVNVDDNPELAMRYGIRSIPTLSVIRDGEVVSSRSGVSSVSDVRDFVQNAAA